MDDQTALGGATSLGEPPQARIHCRRHGDILTDETTHRASHYTHSTSASAHRHRGRRTANSTAWRWFDGHYRPLRSIVSRDGYKSGRRGSPAPLALNVVRAS